MAHDSCVRGIASALLFTGAMVVMAAQPRRGIRLELIQTVDVPGFTQEIVQYCPSQKLLLATNPHWKTVDVYVVESLNPPVFDALDFDDEYPGVQGMPTLYDPTSVAVHPTLPVALVTIMGRTRTDPGRVVGIDLRRPTLGAWVFNQHVGLHPDSIAISPDGRWAIIACEAEENPDTPGSIWAIDLTGLTADKPAKDQPLRGFEITGLAKLLRQPAGVIEPEFVAMDPQSRFAVVSCQENDALVFVDLKSTDGPRLTGFTSLSPGGEPDGVAVLDHVLHPDDAQRIGCLIAVAEEGKFDKSGRWTGQFLTLLWFDPNLPGDELVRLSSTHVPAALGDKDLNKRRDPESVQLIRREGRDVAILGVERGDYLMAFDVTDPRRPELCDHLKVGDRPEGLILVDAGDELVVITGDEGNDGPGTISFSRLTIEPRTTLASP